MSALNKCEGCYQITLPECPELIEVKAGLEPESPYYWFIVDKFFNKYYDRITTDNEGNFEIDTELLPSGLLSSHGGVFELFIKEQYNSCVNEVLTLCGQNYDCVQITFENTTQATEDESGSGDAAVLITIPCDCPDESGGGS